MKQYRVLIKTMVPENVNAVRCDKAQHALKQQIFCSLVVYFTCINGPTHLPRPTNILTGKYCLARPTRKLFF